VATIYGTNNGIDEAVLNVLLRKHRQIRDELGVSIPVPGSNDEFIETVFENLFGAQQLTFDSLEAEKPKSLRIRSLPSGTTRQNRNERHEPVMPSTPSRLRGCG